MHLCERRFICGINGECYEESVKELSLVLLSLNFMLHEIRRKYLKALKFDVLSINYTVLYSIHD